MSELYKKIHRNQDLLKNTYKIFVVLSAIMFIYIVIDIYSKSKTSISFADDEDIDPGSRVIQSPRMQLEPNSDDFHYIISDKGIWNVAKDEVELHNVKAESTLGIITSDTVNIKDDNMLLEFRGNPVFTLYLEEDTGIEN